MSIFHGLLFGFGLTLKAITSSIVNLLTSVTSTRTGERTVLGYKSDDVLFGADVFNPPDLLQTGWVDNLDGSYTATAADSGIVRLNSAVAGVEYLFTYTIDEISAGSIVNISGAATSAAEMTTGPKEVFLTADVVGHNFFRGNTFTGTISNLDVKPVTQPSLLTVPTLTPAFDGMRLATTVADGASTATPRTDLLFTTVATGVISAQDTVTMDGTQANYQTSATAGLGSFSGVNHYSEITVTGTGKVRVESLGLLNFSGAGTYFVSRIAPSAIVGIQSDTGANLFNGTVTIVSCSDVIPTWYSTDINGVELPSPKGLNVADAGVNLFLNSDAPVTQNITTTAQTYTISVCGTGDITVSGTATGTATEGSPLTVTATAGTLTCTVTGTLSIAQVETGTLATPFIITAGATGSRNADLNSILTADLPIAPEQGAVDITLTPDEAGQSKSIMALYTSNNDFIEITTSPTVVGLNKRIGAVNHTAFPSYAHLVDVPMRIQLYWDNVIGIGCRVAAESADITAIPFTTDANTDLPLIPAVISLGHRNNTLIFKSSSIQDPIFHKSAAAAGWV